ncbi:hypothetical protein GWK47_036598 [Chionoecetes opilio]|uniref:Uncharacterized protein n=1 Tax=Chionoecetes opilio TaxID=41210 RepID=A0A8J4YT42_CHIOP|nr:hypothetical protein GWK47_036598 [Chionoecetes opilio]
MRSAGSQRAGGQVVGVARPFNQHTPSASCGECQEGSGAPPAPGPPKPHTHTERWRDFRRFPRVRPQAQNFLPHRHLQQQFRKHRFRGFQGSGGEPDVGDPPLHSPELFRRGKKGTTQLQGGRRDYSIRHGGTPRCSPRSMRLGWQVTCHQRGRGGRYSPPQAGGAH